MEALVGLLKDTFTSLPILQVFVGGVALIVIGYMVIRGHGDRQTAATPAPAVGTVADVPPIFAQGPREMLDIMRELRDLGRRNDEDLSDIREAVRGLLDLARRMVDLLDRIEREQSIANRARRIGRDGA